MLALVSACASRAASAPPIPEKATMEPTNRGAQPLRCLLMEPYSPGGREPVPAAFAHAAATHERGRTDFDAGDHAAAAAAFVRAAAFLRLPDRAAYRDVATENRGVFFHNAACAWMKAESPARARSELARLERDGLASKAELTRASAAVEAASR
jgi:hypothetical protein